MKTNLIQDYKVFEGRYNAQMPLLVNEGLQPLTSKDVMQYRLQAIQSKDKDEMDFWLNQYFDTVTGLAYHSGELIIIPNSQLLSNINPESKLRIGSLILSPDQYERLSKRREVIKRDKVKSREYLTKKEAKEHPIWIKLAQEDKSLLNEYVDVIFAKAEEEIDDYDKNMGISLPDDQDELAIREWCLGNLNDRSLVSTRGSLDDNYSRLLGMRKQNLERIVQE